MYHKLITAAATEPVTAANTKLYTRIVGSTEDDLIDTWIAAGRKLAEDFQNRAYITQTWELYFDCFPPSPFNLPRPPLVSITSIKYYDTDETEYTVSSDDYIVDTCEIGRVSLQHGGTWPSTTLRPVNGVIVRFVAGYGAAADVPESVKDAIYLYCAYRYENRTGEYKEIPKAFYDILRPERVWNC